MFPENGSCFVALKFEMFSSVFCSSINVEQDEYVFYATSVNGLFQMFKRSKFLDVFNESEESEE